MKKEKSFFPNFSVGEWVLFSFILLLGIIFRWYNLDLKPFHHDESLYATYGNYAFVDPLVKFYQYHPMLHGPFLFNLYPWVFEIFGVTNWSARMPMTLAGTLIIFLPFFFRHKMTKAALLMMTAAFSLSAHLIYWSRFVGHDVFVFLAQAMSLYGFFCVSGKWKFFVFSLGLTWQFCIKENAFVTLFIILGYIIFEGLFKRIFHPLSDHSSPSLFKKFCCYIKEYPKQVVISLLVCIFVFLYFYSAGFRYQEGVLDGLYRKSFLYWLGQHQVQRISGPFSFHLLFLTWYELIFMSCLCFYFIYFYKKIFSVYKWGYLLIIIFITTLFILSEKKYFPSYFLFYKNTFKPQILLDYFLPMILIVHAIFSSVYHLKRKEESLAFFSYLFFASFFSYSYLGEKVPWLSQYIYIPGAIYLVLYFEKNCHDLKSLLNLNFSKYLLAFLCLFQLRMIIITNFSRASLDTEFISQVHTTKAFEDLGQYLRQEVLVPVRGIRPKILVLDDPIWPMTWYLRDLPPFSFQFQSQDPSHFDYVILRSGDFTKLRKTHDLLAIPLRGWWVPDYDHMGIYEFISYAISHKPWNSSGSLYVTFARLKQSLK